MVRKQASPASLGETGCPNPSNQHNANAPPDATHIGQQKFPACIKRSSCINNIHPATTPAKPSNKRTKGEAITVLNQCASDPATTSMK